MCGDICPSCRSKMSDAKSLLAVTVVENIDHKCGNFGCAEEFPLTELKAHMNICSFMLIMCPISFCEENVAFCNLVEHLTVKCPYNSVQKPIPIPVTGFLQQRFSDDPT
eukprot:TRINITY_DN17970_c0_g1_i1.p1 TRINITY_DN17970_c0_g1~~TRINITY_DN17970_c0_g1_i1.p1  ORF type:complete len:109 (-),score=16.81 TRINITY_DN17970_c0_g1_i1:378-704(-)